MSQPMPQSSTALERRITVRLVGYWEKLRGNRVMPAENDIDPEDLADLWDYCFLVQVRDFHKKDYNYTYLGSAIMEAYRGGLSLDDKSCLVDINANKLSFDYAKVIQDRAPTIQEGQFVNAEGNIVKYRQCLLPLGPGGEVDAIFGGMRFKVFPAGT